MKFYNYIFYSFYLICGIFTANRPYSAKFSTSFIAVLLISFLFFFNIILLFPFILYHYGHILIVIIALNFMYFLYKKRYIKVIEHYEKKENADSTFWGMVCAGIYAIVIITLSCIYF